MPQNSNSRSLSEPLSVGNVVSAGLRIYRDNFKTYYIEALKGFLWGYVSLLGILAVFSTVLIGISSVQGNLNLGITIALSCLVFRLVDIYSKRNFAMRLVLGVLVNGLVYILVYILGFLAVVIFTSASQGNLAMKLVLVILALVLVVVLVIAQIYGLAKMASINGMIGRLAYQEVVEQPESIPEARLRVKPRLWSFLLANILLGLIFFGILIIPTIILGILAAIMGGLFAQGNPTIELVLVAVVFILVIALVFGFIWFYSRLAFVDLAIAIDGIQEPTKAIGRSWNLTQGFVVKIQIIFFIAFLLTIPLSIISNVGTLFLQNSSTGSIINLILTVLTVILTVLTGALLLPFWQSIKAVIYYDLLTRKEGFGLNLGDSTDNF